MNNDDLSFYPLSGEGLPADVSRAMHPWIRDFLGKNSEEARELLASKWAELNEPMLLKLKRLILDTYAPVGFSISSSACVAGADHAFLALEQQGTSDPTSIYFQGPPETNILMQILQTSLVSPQDMNVAREFYLNFHGFRFYPPESIEGFVSPLSWKRFGEYGYYDDPAFVRDLIPADPDRLWYDSIVFYSAISEDMILFRVTGESAWCPYTDMKFDPIGTTLGKLIEKVVYNIEIFAQTGVFDSFSFQ